MLLRRDAATVASKLPTAVLLFGFAVRLVENF